MTSDHCQLADVAVFDASGSESSMCLPVICSDARVICAPSGCFRMLLLEEVSTGAVARLVWVPIGSNVSQVHTGHIRALIVQ